jgi:hypothetical protein
MRFLQDGRGQIPQQVVMDAYPSWQEAPTYRCKLTNNAAYYDDTDLYEGDESIQAVGNDVNYGFLHQAGRLF